MIMSSGYRTVVLVMPAMAADVAAAKLAMPDMVDAVAWATRGSTRGRTRGSVRRRDPRARQNRLMITDILVRGRALAMGLPRPLGAKKKVCRCSTRRTALAQPAAGK